MDTVDINNLVRICVTKKSREMKYSPEGNVWSRKMFFKIGNITKYFIANRKE